MKKIGDLLGDFAKIAQESVLLQETVAEAIRHAGVPIKNADQITIKGTFVRVRTTAIGKNELFLKQKRILDELAQNPLTKNITRVG